MPALDNNRVLINNCIIVWDGVTRPETLEAKPGEMPGQKWNLKLVIDPNNPDLQALDQAAQTELQQSDFKGVLPNGGLMPIGMTNPSDSWAQFFPGYAVVNASTYRQPDVYDENGQQLQPMQYGPMIYNGQRVNVIVHCKAYNNKSRGVAARMDGFQIVTSANAERLNIGGGGYDCGAAFGGGGQQAPQGNGQQAWGNGGGQQGWGNGGGQQAPQGNGGGQQAPQGNGGGQQAPQGNGGEGQAWGQNNPSNGGNGGGGGQQAPQGNGQQAWGQNNNFHG